jgi:hypothetical protein
MPNIAMRESRGMIPGYQETSPSRCRPGRARLLTYPFARGSLSKSSATIGMLVVASMTAATPSGVGAKMTFTLNRTRSAAVSRVNCDRKLVKRYSIARFLPATWPASARPRRNAAIRCGIASTAGAGGEKADHRHRLLLGACSERPYRRRRLPTRIHAVSWLPPRLRTKALYRHNPAHWKKP